MICIYHSKDNDGYCSGAIVRKKYPDATLIGYDYGQPFPWDKIPAMEQVIMVDVSLPMEQMHELLDHSGDFTWIDHHASAIKAYQEYDKWPDYAKTRFKAVLEDGIAACEGTWKYLFPDEEMPRTVVYLGMYDTWRNEDKQHWRDFILPFQWGMRLNVFDANSFPQELLDANTSEAYTLFSKILVKGDTILTYQTNQNIRAMKASFVIDFFGYRVLCCNVGGANSQMFDSVYNEDEHDIMMPFFFSGNNCTCSLYTTKEIDCSELAKSMGGGGHKKAAGFKVTLGDYFLTNLLKTVK